MWPSPPHWSVEDCPAAVPKKFLDDEMQDWPSGHTCCSKQSHKKKLRLRSAEHKHNSKRFWTHRAGHTMQSETEGLQWTELNEACAAPRNSCRVLCKQQCHQCQQPKQTVQPQVGETLDGAVWTCFNSHNTCWHDLGDRLLAHTLMPPAPRAQACVNWLASKFTQASWQKIAWTMIAVMRGLQ